METEEPTQKPKSKKRIIIVSLIVLGMAVLAGVILKSTFHTDSTAGATSQENTVPVNNTPPKVDLYQDLVTIGARYVSPVKVKVKVGDSVAWVNKDRSGHTIVSDSGTPSFTGQAALGYKDMYLVTFKTAGTYTYHDESNPGSTGIITVE